MKSYSPEELDYYHTIDKGTGETIVHSRKQDEMEKHLKNLDMRLFHDDIIADYKHLNGFEPRTVFNDFKEQAEGIVNDINSLQGDLYTQEGKNKAIRNKINTLAENKLSEVEGMEMNYQEKHADTLAKLDNEIHKQDDLTAEQVAQITLRNNDLLGEIKGKLYTINDTRNLEYEFNILADQSKHDKSLARFLTKNYYLFLDKINEFDTTDMDKQRAMQIITNKAEQIKNNSYSNREHALQAIRDELTGKRYSNTGVKRNIENHKEHYLQKYA